jgi:RNA-binding protein
MELKELKQQAKNLEPILRIGKFGLTDSIHSEIDKLLKKRKLIKIKILNNSPVEDIDEMIENITQKSGSVLVSRIGNVFSLYRASSKEVSKNPKDMPE